MKFILLLALIINLTEYSFAQDNSSGSQKLNEKNGFRDAKFGSDFSTFERMRLKLVDLIYNETGNNGNYKFELGGIQPHFTGYVSAIPAYRMKVINESPIKFYIRTNEQLMIGDFKVTSPVIYGFYKSKLFYIQVDVSNIHDMKEILVTEYGKGDYNSSQWKSENVMMNLSRSFLIVESRPIETQMEKDWNEKKIKLETERKKSIKNATNDL